MNKTGLTDITGLEIDDTYLLISKYGKLYRVIHTKKLGYCIYGFLSGTIEKLTQDISGQMQVAGIQLQYKNWLPSRKIGYEG